MTETLLRAERVQKSFIQGGRTLEILKGLDLQIKKGDALAIIGSSGAGKSTFLHLLGALDRPSLGSIYFHDQDFAKLSDEELARIRNEKIGFVFQFHHLLPEFTALENVLMPLRVAGLHPRSAEEWAAELFEEVGLADRKHHFPSQLSGGELQRVAIVRSLIRRPEILFADEPTGNLDSQNSEIIQELFFRLKEKLGLTLVVVTHDLKFASLFPKTLTLKAGHWVRNATS